MFGPEEDDESLKVDEAKRYEVVSEGRENENGRSDRDKYFHREDLHIDLVLENKNGDDTVSALKDRGTSDSENRFQSL